MITYSCDGCSNTTNDVKISKNNRMPIPNNWLTFIGTFHNDMEKPAGLIYGGSVEYHFCSERCFAQKLLGRKLEPIIIEEN